MIGCLKEHSASCSKQNTDFKITTYNHFLRNGSYCNNVFALSEPNKNVFQIGSTVWLYCLEEKRFRNPIFLFSDFCFHLSIAKAEIVHKGFFAKLLIKAHKRTHVTKHLSNKKGKKQQKLFVNPKNELKLFCVNNECIYSE